MDKLPTKGIRGLFGLFRAKHQPQPAAPAPPADEAATEEEGLPAETEPDTIMEAADSVLYQTWHRISGAPPQEEGETFDAALFLAPGLSPSEESLILLKKLDKSAADMAKRWNAAETEPVDAQLVLLVSADRLRVYLFAFPPMFGGADLSRAAITELLEKDKVAFGVNEDLLGHIEKELAYMKLFLIAEGVPPVDGKDGQVVDHYRRKLEIRLTVRPDNTIDYRDLGWLQTAMTNDLICDIIPPEKGTPGTDVYGRELKAKDGRKAKPPKGANTALNEEGTCLLAGIDGVVSFENERFRVDPLLIIDGNTDISIGHLDVVGDVLIKGDVLEGFRVKATGNITVNGGVEGAFLDAGGNVQIGLGMNGNSAGKIFAGKDVYSKFFENTSISAGGAVVSDTIINSQIDSESEVRVTTGRGAIIGGSITALSAVKAVTLGNHSNRAMEIFLGNTKAYLEEKRALEDTRHAEALAIDSIHKDLVFLQRQTDTPVKREKMNELNLQLKMRRLKFSKLEAEYKKLLLREADPTKCRLRAQVVYPTLTVTIGDMVKTIRKNVFNALIYYKDGEIHVVNV